MARSIAVLVGSLRKESFTRRITRAVESVTPGLAFTQVAIGELPLYNEDLDGDPPAAWTAMRETLMKADGYLFATPEYNRSISGVLKNAIDVASRPYGKSAFGKKKPAAVISVTPHGLGAFGANHHLRQALVYLDLAVLPQPEMYISDAKTLLDANGEITNAETKKLFTQFGEAFTAWVEQHAAKKQQ
jgi:chromate reductase